MGTNYYLNTNHCPCCGKARTETHLGKASYGWKFLFHKTGQVVDYNSFCEFIKTGVIKDEYGRDVNPEELLTLIRYKQADKDHPNVEIIDGYNFLGGEFC